MTTKKAIYMTIPMLGILLGGCDSDALLKEEAPKDVRLAFLAPTLTAEGGETPDMPAEATLYIFSGGALSSAQTIDPADAPEITVSSTDRVFCVAGEGLPSIKEGTTLDSFLESTVKSPAGAQSAPMFYAGAGLLDNGGESMYIELRRGVARLDIACADPKVEIRSIVVENAPGASYILSGENPYGNEKDAVSYSLNVASDAGELIEQAFTLFESATAVDIRIKGRYDGDPMNLATRIPVVERNKKYTVNVSGGSELTSAVTISEWQEGETVEGNPVAGETAIDLEASDIPADVSIDPVTNKILFPHSGVKDMKIAFTTREPLEITRRLGDMEKISIKAVEPVAKDGAYQSAFIINVPAQPKCANSYDATIVLSGSTDFFLDMETEPSPFQIPTVFIAGHEWMCFNAISSDIEEQLYLTDGLTAEEMYNNRFVDCVGNFFQFGKENPFSPWASNDPNQFAEQTADIPWQTVGRMPLPNGFHVAGVNEWRDLVPNNTNIPAEGSLTYQCATGDSIRATVVTLDGTLVTPSEATNKQNYKMRYVLFESLSTGAKLYIPFIGIKSNTKDEIPTQAKFRFETRTAYWIKEERYIMLLDYKKIDAENEGVNIQSNRWNALGFVGTRGIKD